MVKNVPTIQETWIETLGWEDLQRREWQTHRRVQSNVCKLLAPQVTAQCTVFILSENVHKYVNTEFCFPDRGGLSFLGTESLMKSGLCQHPPGFL